MKRSTKVFLAFVPLLLAVGCVHAPDSYPPPVQDSHNLAPWELDPPFAEMNACDAPEYIVKDISATPEGTGWRWTFQRPELRFILNCTGGQKFTADFGIVGATLAQTGPITISFRINNRLLGEMYCATPGDRHFEKLVPAFWLSTKEYTRVVIQADKLYVAERDGAKLGFTLYRAGFVGSCGKP